MIYKLIITLIGHNLPTMYYAILFLRGTQMKSKRIKTITATMTEKPALI